jgi:carotenoid cleavage dioxygenase-like enzyme
MNEWKPEQKNRFYFIHKETGKVVKTEILSKEAFFFYHFLNCFELGDNLVIDVFCMPNFNLVENQTIVNLRGGYKPRDCDSPTLNRFVIPLIASDIKKCSDAVSNLISGFNTTAKAYKSDNKIILEPELLSSTRMEFSTINKTLLGRPLRYVWSSGAFSVSIHHHKIFKFDIETKNTLSWEGKEYQFVGEPTFVPSPEANDEDEDEGILINVVTNMEDVDGELDFVLFLDAKTLRELGRAYFKADIPAALHGVYLSE